MTILKIENLSVDYHAGGTVLHALRNVSINIGENRVVGIVGESGCGKSTLASTILGLASDNCSVAGGSVIFEGRHNLLQLSADEMRALRGVRIATVFQDPMGALNPVKSIGRQMMNIQYRSSLSASEKRSRSCEMLSLVRIPDAEAALSRYPHQFSGGMKQRIAIAMALMMEPALLIADEPTTALDATLEVAVIELLKELLETIGLSVIFISHHLGVVAELCDEVVVMYAGEVVEFGQVDEIFNDPRHPYTRKLLECDPARQADRTRNLPTIPGNLPELHNLPNGCVFANRCHLRHEECDEPQSEVRLENGRMAKCNLADSTASKELHG